MNQGENIIIEKVDYVHVLKDLSFVNFTADHTYGLQPFNVSFTGFTNIENVLSWQWNFGDGTTAQDIQNPVHNYQESGTYHVALQIIAEAGTASEYKVNYIHGLPVVPCPETVTDDDGNVYNTIRIGDQCWMAENLNVGTKIDKIYLDEYQTNNGVAERYCLYNNLQKCDKYGGLYQWDEAMQYSNESGAQDICPAVRHIPSDEEWKILEGYVDESYPIGDSEWDKIGFRGNYIEAELKIEGLEWVWEGYDSDGFAALPGRFGNTDIFGFTAF